MDSRREYCIERWDSSRMGLCFPGIGLSLSYRIERSTKSKFATIVMSREQYSREAFEEAQKQDEREASREVGVYKPAGDYEGVEAAEGNLLRDWMEWRRSGTARMETLLKAGHQEGIKLNKEYERLSRRALSLKTSAEAAEREFRKFCRENLDMKERESKTL
jgi:hypothetical protein